MSIGKDFRLVQNNDKLKLVIEKARHMKDVFDKMIRLK